MITQRKTIIPIFNYKLTIVIFDRWEELEGSIPQDEMDTEANAINRICYYILVQRCGLQIQK